MTTTTTPPTETTSPQSVHDFLLDGTEKPSIVRAIPYGNEIAVQVSTPHSEVPWMTACVVPAGTDDVDRLQLELAIAIGEIGRLNWQMCQTMADAQQV